MIEERYEEDVASADKDDPVTALKYQYVWGQRYIDAPIVRDEDTSGDGDCIDAKTDTDPAQNTGDEHLYYCQDANFNVTALVDDYDGAVVERYMYSPYGEVTVLHGDRDSSGTDTSADEWSARTSNTFENAVLYCGYYQDSETGLYHVRNRYYHPPLGRWASRDPIGYADGMGLYEYGASAPNLNRDPTGLWVPENANDLGGRQYDYRWEVAPAAAARARSSVKVRLEVQQQEGGGGSIDVKKPGGGKVVVAMTQPGAVNRALSATRRLKLGIDVDIYLHTSVNPKSFIAVLGVSVSARKAVEWQICPLYAWDIVVHNICCYSGTIRVISLTYAGPRANAVAPASGEVSVAVGEKKLLGKVKVDIVVHPLVTSSWSSQAMGAVEVQCMP